MKASKILLIALCTLALACGKEEENIVPKKSDNQLREDISNLDINGDAELITTATSVVETDAGYKLEGSLSAHLEGAGTFEIAAGNFEFTVDGNGKIIKISGEGLVDFPNVGVFSKIRETFSWQKIKSHIEYELGSFYKNTYQTDIPLTDDRYYFHFKVFDESAEEGFSLKHLGNLVVYNFADFYLDANDPAVFFKMQVWKPGAGSGSEAGSVAKQLFAKLKSLASEVKDYASAPGVVIGISNQATIVSSSYEFSKPEVFQELFGYSGFDEMRAHGYLKLKNVPIPETVVLRFTGDMYVQGPIDKIAPSPDALIAERENAFVDWFNETEIGPISRTVNGSVDFGGKGIEFVLGLLPNINTILNYDVFNNDFNLDLVGATYQDQAPGIAGGTPSFLRFGGEFRKPILADLLGADISKFIPSQPAPTGFLYLNIEDQLENWSLFIESTADLIVPVIGKTQFSDSYFLLNKDGVRVEGNLTLPSYGIFNFDQKFKGMIGPKGYAFESDYTKSIDLPNGITLAANNLKGKVSNTDGLYVEGSIKLPLGITDAHVLGTISGEKVFFEGDFSQGLELGNFNLPSRDMIFRTSSDPEEGISYSGSLNIPHIGYNAVTGTYNKSEFSFLGEINRTIDFKGVQIPISAGTIALNANGIHMDGKFTLPFGLKSAQVSGDITKEEIKLSGTLGTGITVGGFNFPISKSYINASNLTGIKLGGFINLRVFSERSTE